MSQIRITKTPELERVVQALKTKWVLLDEVEIVKMALSQTYHLAFEQNLTLEEKKGVAESFKNIENGDYTVLSSDKEIEKHFENL